MRGGVEVIPTDVLAKLPDAARAKLQLIADLAADAMADAEAALTRLNALARRQGSSEVFNRRGGGTALMQTSIAQRQR
jgi:hypothetical protein